MWVKRCCCDWIGATVLKEAGMWYDTVEECTIDVEEVDVMFVRSPTKFSVTGISNELYVASGVNLRGEDWCMLVDAESS